MVKKLLLLLMLIVLCSFAYADVSLTDIAIGYTYDDADITGNDPDDVTGNDMDGTNIGTALISQVGIIDEAFYFDGASDYIDLTTDLHYPGGQDFSVSLWFNTTGTNSVAHGHGLVSNLNGWGHVTVKNNKAGFLFYDLVDWQSTVMSVHDINNGNWYHLVLVHHSDATCDLWINGTKDRDGVSCQMYDGGPTRQFDVERMMKSSDGGNGGELLGSMDEVYIWNRSISDAEIGELYNDHAGFTYPFTTPLVTSCSCPVAGDWSWIMSDNCNITTDCDIGDNNVYIGGTDTGTWQINATITAKAASYLNGTIGQYVKGLVNGFLNFTR